MSRNYAVTLLAVALISFSRVEDTYAMLDFLAQEAKDVARAAAVVDATAGLIGEIAPDSQGASGAEQLRDQSSKLLGEISEVQFLSRDTQDFIKGPKLSSNRLDQNIRATTGFIRQGKNIVMRLAALGTDAVVAINGVQTNIALNEVQKNQQTLIVQNEQMMNRDANKEVREAKEWTDFISNQKKIRRTSGRK